MEDDSLIQDGIRASLKAMHLMLLNAAGYTGEASCHADQNQRNIAIGTIILVEDLLEQAAALYKAVIAMHRFKPAEGK